VYARNIYLDIERWYIILNPKFIMRFVSIPHCAGTATRALREGRWGGVGLRQYIFIYPRISLNISTIWFLISNVERATCWHIGAYPLEPPQYLDLSSTLLCDKHVNKTVGVLRRVKLESVELFCYICPGL